MESALKQRLLGAVVLIALAIIFVPMFLSGSGPKQESETINLEIPPAPSREFETRVLSVDSASGTPEPVAVPAKPSETIVAVETQTAPREEPPAPPTAAKPEPVVPAGPTQAEAPRPATPAPNTAGEAATARYLVHLGVYASQKNAADLVTTLKGSGFAAYAETTEFQGKAAQRVRVGPYADRAEAEAARIRIKQIRSDVPGSVVTLGESAAADAPPAAVPAARAGSWAVQLGAFKTVEDANKLRGRLQAAAFVAYVDKLATDGQTLWRVRAGPETDRANAEKLRDRIREKLKIDGLIVSEP